MSEKKIPGCAIAILKDNTTVKLKGYGLASIEFNAPVTTETKFLLDGYADGELDLVNHLEFETHINDCPACRVGYGLKNISSHVV